MQRSDTKIEKTPPSARVLLLGRREDGVRLLIRQRHPVEHIEELALGLGREAVHDVGDLPNQLLERGFLVLGHRVAHQLARPLLDFRQRPEHLLALAGVRHVVGDRRPKHGFEVLRAVGQRGVGADRDALHALRAVFRDVERCFAPGHVLRRGVAAAGGHDAERRIRRRRLVVAVAGAELGVERGNLRERRSLGLTLGHWMRSAAAAEAVAGMLWRNQRQERLAAHAGPIGCRDVADGDFLDALEALGHDLHVGDHDGVAQPSELLHVLLVHDIAELFLSDAELLEQRRHGEERSEERVALHAELEVAAVGRFPGNLEPGQRVDADLLLDDLLASPQGQPLPRLFAFLVRLPHQRAALLHSVERVGMRERLGVAAEDHVGVTQVAVHPDALRCGDHEVGGRRALLLGSVLGIRADVDDFLRVAEFVHDLVAVVEQVVQVADDRAEVLAGRDRAPPADRMETHRDISLRQQGGRFVRLHFVGMIDPEHEEGHSIRRALAVLALALADGEFVRANRVLGAEISRPQAVHAAEQPWHLLRGDARQAVLALQRFVQRHPDVLAHRVVARERLVGALEDDDVLLPGERLDDGGFREGAEDVRVNRPHLDAARLAHVVDRRLDVLRRRTQRHEHRVRILRLVLG